MAAQTTSEKIETIVNEGLFPSWTIVIATILAVLVLMIFLTKLLYKPVKKNFEDRQKYIQQNIDGAEIAKKDATSDREKANDELIAARIEAADIITAAKVEAGEVKAQGQADAKQLVLSMKEEAKADIVAQQAKFDAESREAIIEVALDAAAKVVEKEVDNKTNRKIVEDFVATK